MEAASGGASIEDSVRHVRRSKAELYSYTFNEVVTLLNAGHTLLRYQRKPD